MNCLVDPKLVRYTPRATTVAIVSCVLSRVLRKQKIRRTRVKHDGSSRVMIALRVFAVDTASCVRQRDGALRDKSNGVTSFCLKVIWETHCLRGEQHS